MEVTINGLSRSVEPKTTIKNILEDLQVKEKTMAVAVNMEIVKEKEWNSYLLQENDKVELLHFVGGG
ncbi:MAG TPA: sulfur carrier protein ThiS [Nitratifractor sp.]|nr:sulfur carrier protein ThiS [Nitratifractor sp.]HHD74828.1 sulfur carrier protein ThiS [Nitratifractor sp.]HHH20541.1 sulfur carrier protein ThiS [Nitratifractor sp.]